MVIQNQLDILTDDLPDIDELLKFAVITEQDIIKAELDFQSTAEIEFKTLLQAEVKDA